MNVKGNTLVSDWIEELSARVGRGTRELEENGLGASDFRPDSEVHVEFEDGTAADPDHGAA